MVDARYLLPGQSCLFRVVTGQLTFRLDYIAESRGPVALRLRERVERQLVQAGDDEKPLTRVREPEVMRRDQAMSAAGHVLGATDVIAKFSETSFDNPPGPAMVVPLEVTDVFQDHVLGPTPLQNLQNLVEERSPRLVAHPTLVAGLREWLAWKAGAENVVGRHFLIALSDVTVDDPMCVREVLQVELPEFLIELGDKHAFVAEAAEGNVKSAKTGK